MPATARSLPEHATAGVCALPGADRNLVIAAAANARDIAALANAPVEAIRPAMVREHHDGPGPCSRITERRNLAMKVAHHQPHSDHIAAREAAIADAARLFLDEFPGLTPAELRETCPGPLSDDLASAMDAVLKDGAR